MRDRQTPETPVPNKQDIQAIISEGKPEPLVEWAEKIGQSLARQVTTSQLRNVFGTVRQIQMSWDADPTRAYRDAVLLKPKLGYFAKRERGRGMADLERVLVPAIEEIIKAEKEFKSDEERAKAKKDRFMRFSDFFEAIVAYHKKYGGY
jgi:CRISPR-associated protein Csm2